MMTREEIELELGFLISRMEKRVAVLETEYDSIILGRLIDRAFELVALLKDAPRETPPGPPFAPEAPSVPEDSSTPEDSPAPEAPSTPEGPSSPESSPAPEDPSTPEGPSAPEGSPAPEDSLAQADDQAEEEEEEEGVQKLFRDGLQAIQELLVEAGQIVDDIFVRSDTVTLVNVLRQVAQRAEALADEAAIQCNGEYDPSWVDPADEELQRLRDEEAEAEYQRSLGRWMAEEEALMAAQVEDGWLRPLASFAHLASLDELLQAAREKRLRAEFEDGQWWTTGEDVHYWRRRRRNG